MGKKPVVVVIEVIVLIVVAVLAAKNFMGSDAVAPGTPTWYDTGSGELYPGPKGVKPPAPAPSGKDGVLAAIYAKGSCDDKADRFIGFMLKYTEEGKTLLNAAEAETPPDGAKIEAITATHKLVKREKDTEWVTSGSKEGQAILTEARRGGAQMCHIYLE